MDKKERYEIEKIVSEQLDKKLWINQRVELAKMEAFVTKINSCLDSPTDEFMLKHQVNDREATLFIWAALEEWQKMKQYDIIDYCSAEGCIKGKRMLDGMTSDCPVCEGRGFHKIGFTTKTPEQINKEYQDFMNSKFTKQS